MAISASEPRRDGWFLTRHASRLALFTALLLAGLAALPLFLNSGFLNTRGIGDSPNLLFRVHQLLASLAAGQFPARWMPDAAYGYGMPYFTYYASFSTHVAAAFKLYGFSFVNAIKLAQLLALLVAAGGLDGWLRAIGFSPAARWLASAAYTFAPFHLVNLYIRGDSLAELWAMSLFPLVLWAAHLCLEQLTFPRAFALALAIATLICTHNISALNFMPFVALYVLSQLISQQHLRTLFPHFLPLLWGFALAAFFWLPALLESDAVQLSGLTSEFFSFAHHFRGADLVQLSFLFDYQTNPFSMGLLQTLLAVSGLLAALWHAARTRHWPPLNTFLLSGLALSTLMMTPLSQPLWENLPLVKFTQFPWRFLSIQALFTAALAAHLVNNASKVWLTRFFSAPLLTCVLSVLLAASALQPLNLQFIPLTDEDVTAERLNWYEYFTTAIGNTVNSEYLPQAVQPRPFSSETMLGRAPQPKALSGAVSGERVWKRGASENWQLTVSGDSPATAAVPTYYWPGWQATANGQPLTVRATPGLGWITFDLPPGAYTVKLWLGRTPLRAAAEIFSALAFFVPLGVYFYRKGFPKFPFSLRSSVIGVLVIGAGWIWLPFSSPEPRIGPLPLNADYNNLAYFHRNVVRFGNNMELQAVKYNAEEVGAGAPLVIDTMWRLDRSVTAIFTLRSHAAWVGGAEGTLANTSAFIDSAQTSAVVTMTMPTNTPPGLYFITVELHDKQATYPAITATGQERSLVHLAPIRMTQRTAPVELRQPLADYGAFNVQAANAEQNGNRVQLNLLWHARVAVPLNYSLALRVRDLNGHELSGADTQPNYGFYPTIFWQAGELIPDTLTMPRPEGLPPGTYAVSLTPYNPATLAALTPLVLTATLHSPLPPVEIRWPLTADLGLAEVEIPPQTTQGEMLTVAAHWTTVGALSQNYRARWTLTNAAGNIYTETVPLAPGSAPREWGQNLMYFGRAQLAIPDDLAAGVYELRVQLVDENNTAVGNAANVGNVEVLGRERTFTLPPLQTTVGVVFDGQIALAGYNAEQTATELKLQLAFQALATPRGDYKYFVHLFDPTTENIPAQIDTVPRNFLYPTTQWVQDEVVVEDLTLNLSAVPPGAYQLAVGWYNPNANGLPRLPAVDANGQPLDFDRVVLLLEVNILP